MIVMIQQQNSTKFVAGNKGAYNQRFNSEQKRVQLFSIIELIQGVFVRLTANR